MGGSIHNPTNFPWLVSGFIGRSFLEEQGKVRAMAVRRRFSRNYFTLAAGESGTVVSR